MSASPDAAVANLRQTVACRHTPHCSSKYEVKKSCLALPPYTWVNYFNDFLAVEVFLEASSLEVASIHSVQLQRLLVLPFVVDREELTMWFNMYSTKNGQGRIWIYRIEKHFHDTRLFATNTANILVHADTQKSNTFEIGNAHVNLINDA
jgi:hypothetical protein